MPTPKKKPEDKKRGGRPSKYQDTFPVQAEKLALLGLIDEEIAKFFEVAVSTLNLWKIEHPEFSESLKKGRIVADANVAQSLYERATGAEWQEQVAFKVKVGPHQEEVRVVSLQKAAPPDTAAAFIWLQNRRPDRWKRKPEAMDPDDDMPEGVTVKVQDARRTNA